MFAQLRIHYLSLTAGLGRPLCPRGVAGLGGGNRLLWGQARGNCEACPAITGSRSDWGSSETTNNYPESSRKRSGSSLGTSGSCASVPASKATGGGTVVVVLVDIHVVVMDMLPLPSPVVPNLGPPDVLGLQFPEILASRGGGEGFWEL